MTIDNATIEATATANIQTALRTLRDTETKKTRLVASLGIELAKIVNTWDASARTHDTARNQLEEIVKTIVAKDENGVADKDEVRSLMGSASDAVKMAVLICLESSGFVAGYARKDGQKTMVTQEDFEKMPANHQANFAPEVFCDFSKTLPREPNGKNEPKPRTAGYMEVATVKMVDAGHKRHILKKALNSEKTGFATDPKNNQTQPALGDKSSNKDVWQVIDNFKNWLASDSLQSLDVKESASGLKEDARTLSKLSSLSDAIDEAIKRNAQAIREADQQEQREKDAKPELAKAS